MPRFVARALVFGLVALRAASAVCQDTAIDFDRQIAPLLASHCFDCHHGPEAKGGLDLSRRERAMTGGESGAAIVQGKPAESLLWQRVSADEMPPKKPLTREEKALLEQWIAGGAAWGADPIDPLRFTTATRAGYDWWSLQPIAQPHPPQVTHDESVRNSIDRFVLAKLESQGLRLSPAADRRTLIRRLFFDLTGLPPAPRDVEAFVADNDPRAYESLIERLLASPDYGERWARHWLDLARFGESNGFEYDEPRENAWPYRDWVIDALNRDLPFDEFARWQIAGDVLRPDDPEAIKATGFLVAGPFDTAGQGQQSAAMKAVVRQDELEDVIATVCQAFLGLTVNCARCHDHKFDPINQVEYYRLTSALGGVRHGQQDVTPKTDRIDRARRAVESARRIEQLEADVGQLERPIRAQILAERKALQAQDTPPAPIARWDFDQDFQDALGHQHGSPQSGAQLSRGALMLNGDGAYVAMAPLEKDLRAKTLEAWVSLDNLSQRGGAAISLQTLDGGIFDAIVFAEREKGQWMAGSEVFARTKSFDGPRETKADQQPVHVAIVYHADGMISGYRNGRPYGQAYQSSGPVEFKAGQAQVLVGLRHSPPSPSKTLAGTVERVQLYDRALSPDEVAVSARAASDYVAPDSVAQRLPPQDAANYRRWLKELTELRVSTAPVEKQLAYAVKPRPAEVANLLARGDTRQPRQIVSAGGVASLVGPNADFGLPPEAPEAERRLALARWISSPHNPLFARVIVNRLWHHHFGAGLVDTPNDFGFNGGRPSHPELLDHLASLLVERHWSLKAVHREIVSSATYRQSSLFDGPAAKLDAQNRWLWRKSPHRLEAEAVRDAMLAVAGELNPRRGGPGFRDCTEVLRSGTYTYEPGDPLGDEFSRRSIYRTWIRGGRSVLLDVFDCPDPSTTSPRRAVTTTPLQALTLLNGSFVLRMADCLGQRVMRESGDAVEPQIVRAYQLAFARDPTPDELQTARQVVSRHGLSTLARAIFNSNEFLYID